MKMLLSIISHVKNKLWVGTRIKIHLGGRDLLDSKNFPVYFALFVGLIVFIYNLIHLALINDIIDYIFRIIECSGEAKKTDIPVNLNITGKISVSVGEALTAGGIGYGAAKMVQACPPQTRLAATIGLGSIMGTTYLACNAIKTLNSSSAYNKPTPFDNSNPEAPLSKHVQVDPEREDSIIGINSILEMNWFDSWEASPETVLLYCCLIFMGLATYFFIGFILNVLVRNYLNSSLLPPLKKMEERLHKCGPVGVPLARMGKLFYFWLKESNRITTIIISLIILYSQIASILILLYLISLKG